MEESDLLKKRVQAITEKHHIQQLIRMKKVELDREKVKLQHLKKKVLREQWLLEDSQSVSDHQQSRALQLHIHSIEMDIYSLEQEESRICTNEKLILNRLKAVEKSPEELIREVQVSFVPAKCVSTAVEVNSTAPSTRERQHSGHKLYGDSVYALNSQQGSHDMSCISDLSAGEVEQLLRNHHQNLSHVGRCFYKHNKECDARNQGLQYDNYVLGNNKAEKVLSHMEKWQEQSEYRSSRRQDFGNHKRERTHYGIRPSDCCPPSYHHPEVVTAYQPQLCGHISAEEQQCYCYSPPSQTKNNHNPTGSLPPSRYGDNSSRPYTALNNLDATQSITAIFMGFQAAEDETRKSQEFLGSLKAELIIIEESEEHKEDNVKRKSSLDQLGITERAAIENVAFLEELDRRTKTQMGEGIRKLNKHKPCCAIS